MAFRPGAWVGEMRRMYVGNATAVRDYRSQIRGSRALVLLSVYLGIMLLMVASIYGTTVRASTLSLSEAQNALGGFYEAVIMLLGASITAITPALSAMAVAGERQRRSLDLVFSAPVTPYYLLIGKLISSFRWTALLIVLALPISAVSVVMGGATWTDAIGAYILLLLAGLLFSSVGILISTYAPTPASAVVQSYVAVGLYSLWAGSLGAALSFSRFMGGAYEIPWYVGFSPFAASSAGTGSTEILGVSWPNWVPVGVITLMVVRLLLLGAASSLSGYGAKETRSLRMTGAFYMFLFGLIGGLSAPNSPPMSGVGSQFGSGWGALTAALAMPLFVVIPHLVSWGSDADRKYRFDGFFNWRAIWQGTPSGSLPYLIVMWAALYAGSMTMGYFAGGALPDAEFVWHGLWLLAFWTFWWALGQAISGMSRSLKNARTGVFAMWLVLMIIPFPILLPMTFSSSDAAVGIHMGAPLYYRSDGVAIVHTILLLVAGAACFALVRGRSRSEAPPVVR